MFSKSCALPCRRNFLYSSLYLEPREEQDIIIANAKYQELSGVRAILFFTNNSHRVIKADTKRITWGSDAEIGDCQSHRARRTRMLESKVDADSRFASPRAGIIQPELAVETTEFLG